MRIGSDVIVVISVVDGSVWIGEPVRRRRSGLSAGPDGVTVMDPVERSEVGKSRVERRRLTANYTQYIPVMFSSSEIVIIIVIDIVNGACYIHNDVTIITEQ